MIAGSLISFLNAMKSNRFKKRDCGMKLREGLFEGFGAFLIKGKKLRHYGIKG